MTFIKDFKQKFSTSISEDIIHQDMRQNSDSNINNQTKNNITDKIKKRLNFMSIFYGTLNTMNRHLGAFIVCFLGIVFCDTATQVIIHSLDNNGGIASGLLFVLTISTTFILAAMLKMLFMRQIIGQTVDNETQPDFIKCLKPYLKYLALIAFVTLLLKAISLGISNEIFESNTINENDIKTFNFFGTIFNSFSFILFNIPLFLVISVFGFTLAAASVCNKTSFKISYTQTEGLIIPLFSIIGLMMGITLFVDNFFKAIDNYISVMFLFAVKSLFVSMISTFCVLFVFAMFAWLYQLLGYSTDEYFLFDPTDNV